MSCEPQHFAERRAKHENDDKGHADGDTREKDRFYRGDHANQPERRHAAAAYGQPNSRLKRNANDHGQNSEDSFYVHNTSSRCFRPASSKQKANEYKTRRQSLDAKTVFMPAIFVVTSERRARQNLPLRSAARISCGNGPRLRAGAVWAIMCAMLDGFARARIGFPA